MITPSIPNNLRDFIAYKGSVECSGFPGVRNLVSIIKEETKTALKEYGITIPSRNELNEVSNY